jgi:hypothetical protein
MTSTMHTVLSLADLEAYDERPKGNGRERRFLCPECGDTKPRNDEHRSLCVNMETGLWNCKRCSASGKLKDFWNDSPKQAPRMRTQAALRRAFALDEPRLATLPETASTWQEHAFGAQPIDSTPGAEYLERRGFIGSTLPQIARGVRFHHNFMGRPAVLFPFLDRAGQTVALSARYIDGQENGHRVLGPKKSGAFHTTSDVWKSSAVVLTEAPIDALSLQACGVPAVALGGTSGPDWLPAACAFRYVLLALDNDGAGDIASTQLASLLQSFGATTARLRPERAKDWNAMLQQHGCNSLGVWLHARLSHIAHFELNAPPPSTWWS